MRANLTAVKQPACFAHVPCELMFEFGFRVGTKLLAVDEWQQLLLSRPQQLLLGRLLRRGSRPWVLQLVDQRLNTRARLSDKAFPLFVGLSATAKPFGFTCVTSIA